MRKTLVSSMVFCVVVGCTTLVTANEIGLKGQFLHPPDSARPWVYWFWLNGNITPEGITADLEAMQRAGIGGVLIMEVDQGAPLGPVPFMSSQWRQLFKHVVSEAQRLGLEVNMNDDAGWNGSGGPWIKPEQSMQQVVWSEVDLEGPQQFDGTLEQPKTVADYYGDIEVLAFKSPGAFRIEDIQVKAAYVRQTVPPLSEEILPPDMIVDRQGIVDLSDRMNRDGRLAWDVPAGKWTVMRIGHTSTGVENAPAPASGRGLECDKLSPVGMDAQFANMVKPLIDDNGSAVGKTFVATHIDSWENGSQNWTAKMRDEFQKRRGYDLLPFLPVLSGKVVDGLEISERFLWDMRQTVSELVVENYASRLERLAQEDGMYLTIEAYGGPCDDLPYAGRADEPMSEFWIGGGALETCKLMASAAHIYGKPIMGAEAFTADSRERWLKHPGSIKALGDKAFCLGVNRFVFHRYALQPWLNYQPGMTMGPWGLHYERTTTWWDQSRPWHEYLARCQYLLRQGLFVADICYLRPEESPQNIVLQDPDGYDYDMCSAEAVLSRMSVKDGRIVLPDGMSYKLLVLPQVSTMTPRLLQKIGELVKAGATVLGSRPVKSPSLSNYPKCDEDVKQLADELWGDCDGQAVKQHVYGKGKIVCGMTPEELLVQENVAPDVTADSLVCWIHRRIGEQDIYFVSNNSSQRREVECAFRIEGKQPEFWQPETGVIEPVASYAQKDGITRIPIQFEPSGSVFVVFSSDIEKTDPVVSIARNGQQILPPPPESKVNVTIDKAVYGVLDDPARTRDVRAKLQSLVDKGELIFTVSRMAEGDDPAFGIVKTLIADYTVEGKSYQISGQDPEEIALGLVSGMERVAEVHRDAKGILALTAWQAGNYELKTASGRSVVENITALPEPLEMNGPWELHFPPNWGAPEKVTLGRLISWSESDDSGVKYFSGTATYNKTFDVPSDRLGKNRRLYLDLGDVQVIAQVKLNGQALGVLWKPPFLVDVTEIVKPENNQLEVQVTNLWPNRMIGDEQLPEDSERNPDGTLKEWPEWVKEGKASPTGRYTFTSWRLWPKDSKLIASGLIGPVVLRSAAIVPIQP